VRRVAVLVALLAGCSTIPQPPEVANVAVPVSCVPADPPVRPQIYPDAELAGMDDFRFVLALRWNADRLLEYVAELEAVLKGCR
jgi:hypothetical protein